MNHCPSCTQCMFPTLNYDYIHAWRRNLVGHIMKFLTTSPIFRIGVSSSFTLLKRTYSSSWLSYTSTYTQPSYIRNSMQCTPFHVYHNFVSNQFSFLTYSITYYFHNILYQKCRGRWGFFSRYDILHLLT